MDESQVAKWVSLELHTDGSGVYSACIPDLMEGRPMPPEGTGLQLRLVQDEGLVIAVMSGLLQLATHARNRAAAGGNVLMRAQIFPVSPTQTIGLGHNRHHFPDQRGDRILTEQTTAAEAAAELDDLVEAGPGLVAATALLVDETGQAFGVPEMGQLSRDGHLRRRYWSQSAIITWAEEHGIEVTNETIV